MRAKKETAPRNRRRAVNRTEQTAFTKRRRLSTAIITAIESKVNNGNEGKMKRYTGRKIQRTLSGIGAAIELLCVLFICYGVEQLVIPYKLGCYLMLGGVICFAILLWGAGALEGRR